MYRSLIAAIAAAIVACATVQPSPQAPAALLALPPSAYGKTVSLAQQIQIEAAGETHELQVYLQIDRESVNLAAMVAGQTAAKLTWDGHTLHEDRSAWLPQGLRGEVILSDLQLALWPAQVVASALPTSFQLVATPQKRELLRNNQPFMTVEYLDSAHLEIVHHEYNYRLSISSIDLDEAR